VSADRDVTRIIRSWLEEGVTALPDRVLDPVLDQLPATPQRRAMWPARRLLDMHIPTRIAVAAAALLALAVIGVIAIPRGSGVAGLGTTSSPTPVPTTSAAPVPLPSAGALAPGTYAMTPFARPDSAEACITPPQRGCSETAADDSIRVTFAVSDGWEPDPLHIGIWLAGKNNAPPDGAALFFERGGWLYTDPCHTSPPPTIQVGPTVDDFANALANHPSLNTTKPVAVTLGAYAGKYMDVQIPSDISACTDNYWPWEPGIYAQGPSQRWHLWILDVNGIRVVILTTDYAGTSANDRTALQAIVNSIQIQP
jgi:hypothetical protein